MGRGAVAAAVALLCLWGLHVAGVSGMRRFWRDSDIAVHEPQGLPLRPMPHRSSDEPFSQTPDHARDVGHSRIQADPAATRMIRIRGRVLVVERPADSARESSPAALDPLTLGIERDELLKSLVIRIAETVRDRKPGGEFLTRDGFTRPDKSFDFALREQPSAPRKPESRRLH